MVNVTVPIINKLGLHARASAKFVSTAMRFQSNIQVSFQNKTVNGKSIMGVMTLAARCGSEIVLTIEGVDESATEQALVSLIENRFGEAE